MSSLSWFNIANMFERLVKRFDDARFRYGFGGQGYPNRVEDVLNGEMQRRYAWEPDKETGMFHPNYRDRYSVYERHQGLDETRDAISGAFVLSVVGVEGVSKADLDELRLSEDSVRSLVDANGEPVSYRVLHVARGLKGLELFGMVSVDANYVRPSPDSAKILEENPWPPYTVFPPDRYSPLLFMQDKLEFASRILEMYGFWDPNTLPE